jgi:hypothetical protein
MLAEVNWIDDLVKSIQLVVVKVSCLTTMAFSICQSTSNWSFQWQFPNSPE